MVELLRQFHISNPYTPTDDWRIWASSADVSARMGQEIGAPPAVAGWPAYYSYPLYDKEWISTERLAVRTAVIKHLSSKLSRADRESNFDYDLITFVSALSNPASNKQLIEDAVDVCFFAQPAAESKNYLQGLLDKGSAFKQNWSELWAMHTADKKTEDLTEEVKDRLRVTFETMFTLAEYQIR